MGRWLLVLISLAVSYLILEVVLRLRYDRRLSKTIAGRVEDELITEAAGDELLYRLKPRIANISNAYGFRDLERTRQPLPGVYRIAVVGDSVSMQMTIPFEELYWRRLQRSLDRTFGGNRIEILNLSVAGYGTKQQLALLSSEILAFQPRMVLWQFHYNDAADPVIDGGNGGLGWYYSRPSSYLGRFVRRRWTHLLQRATVSAAGIRDIPRELRLQVFYWDQMTRRLETILSLAKTNDFQVFVFMVPVWPENDDWSAYSERALGVHNRLLNRFQELGFPTLDLLPPLLSQDPGRLRYAPDDPWHPNREGHQWMAEQLHVWLTPHMKHALADPGDVEPKAAPEP